MKVLLVDDESYMTEYLKKLVDWKSYGFEEVLTASGGSIARDLIEQKKPELLVTDIRMPRVSGLDLVKYIDEKNYPTKTIILSGYSEFEYAQQALRYGVTEYLVKPILKKDFQISLRKCCIFCFCIFWIFNRLYGIRFSPFTYDTWKTSKNYIFRKKK